MEKFIGDIGEGLLDSEETANFFNLLIQGLADNDGSLLGRVLLLFIAHEGEHGIGNFDVVGQFFDHGVKLVVVPVEKNQFMEKRDVFVVEFDHAMHDLVEDVEEERLVILCEFGKLVLVIEWLLFWRIL